MTSYFIEPTRHRKATLNDLRSIISLLLQDELGQPHDRALGETLDQRYIDAFYKIDADPNQYLMVVETAGNLVGTCHLIIMPSLTYIGSTRMQIEAIRVTAEHTGYDIRKWMINTAIAYGKLKGVSIIQLTTNKKCLRAKRFYEDLGFKASHVGMRMNICLENENMDA